MDRLTYTLEDQALMARARNYFEWQARLIVPETGRRVVEVGCGTGNFTRHLLGRELVVAVDIETACVERLRECYADRPNLRTFVCGPCDAAFAGLTEFEPDSCACINVLEHIEDDAAALRGMAAILPRGGAIVLLVPAFPALYGPIDRHLHHCRRYTRTSLRRLAGVEGLVVTKLRFVNMVGFFGWWANARVFRRQAQSAGQIALFDRCIVPVMSRVEAVVPPPFGQSLLAVLRKDGKGRPERATGLV